MRKLSWIYLAVFITPLIYNPFGLKPYEIAKQGWFLTVIAIFLIGAAVMIWRAKEAAIVINKPIVIIGILWMLSYAVSTIWSIAPIESFWGNYERMQGSFIHIFYVLHFIIAWYLFQNTVFQKFFYIITAGIGVLLSLHAIAQRFGFDPLLNAADAFPGRSFSLMGSPNGLGQFLIFPFIISIYSLCEELRKNTMFRNKRNAIIYGLAALITFAGLWTTYNRASILGIVIAIGILFLYEQATARGELAESMRRRVPIVAAFLAALVVLTFALSYDTRSLGTRSVLWTQSAKLIPQHLSIGSGLSTFYQTFQTVLTPDIYQYEQMTDIAQQPHNEFLNILLERGLFGAILYLINFGFLIWIFFKKQLETTSAKIAFAAIIAYTISVQFSFSLTTHIIMLLSMWVILLQNALPTFKKTFIAAAPIKTLACVLLIGIALISAVASYKTVYADTLLRRALGAYMQNDNTEARAYFAKALNMNPYYIYPYRTAFFFYKKAGIPELAQWNTRVGEIGNNNFQYYLDRAELAFLQNDYGAAEQFFEEARRGGPHWPTLWETWGDLWYEKGEHSKAIFGYEQLLGLAPPYFQWASTLSEKTADEREKYRIFRKTHERFYETMAKLRDSYTKVGRQNDADQLDKFL